MRHWSRRELLAALPATSLLVRRAAAAASTPGRPMRGAFIIMATPYTASGVVDYDDLAREVQFLEKCGVHGMVWPQLASEYASLTRDERMRGMEVLGRASAGRKAALVLGVQGPNTEAALEYLQAAEKLSPDALIAIPPREAKSMDDVRAYYKALAGATRRPLWIQTTGGAPGLVPTVELLIELAREFPNCGYVKEEANPVIERMKALAAARPAIKAVFSGAGGKGMLYEMRLGFDGTMPGAPIADLYPQIWDHYLAGRREKAREIFALLTLMLNLEQQIPNSRPYLLKKRGVFKTALSRQNKHELTPEETAEIDYHFAALKPYLRA
jgi:4-hydroxy-tetrahydrodipicolinate synthase